ncbi:IS1380 family transposase, partial [Kibdelosporangium lantanae]
MSVRFDDPNLVSYAGLVPVMRLAETVGLDELVVDRVRLGVSTGAHPDRKITSIVAGMIAGADCIDDLDLLRHGGMAGVFTAIPVPSTLGSFLRSFCWGDTRALESVARRSLARLTAVAPLLPGADQIAYVDLDSLLRRTFDTTKQGAGFGHTKVGGYSVRLRGLSPLVATISHADRGTGDRGHQVARRFGSG